MTVAYAAAGLLAVCAVAVALYAVDWLLGLWLTAAERRHARSVEAYDALGRWHR